ncbi:nitroreductase family protein [Marinobacterium rhizophilum]|uniref:Nitroreductase family protein n=1 Tax=Marinobacterium rhizophilum TaxID=420402 RepID=A0ABY5HF90_9GAMM|nr:nitroreductase family protein [Marinobacterium rhizophilum]UTW10634.1 nitroreductase family protein [Marinobacterium rhizophilum]
MTWLKKKMYGLFFFRTPIGEILSIIHSMYLHLKYSFSDRSPGKDREKLKYYLAKHCHIVEKGLALPTPRPAFGQPKIMDLIVRTKDYEARFGRDEIIKVVRDTIREYISFHDDKKELLPKGFLDTLSRFVNESTSEDKGGLKHLEKKMWRAFSLESYERFVLHRHSVRNFSDEPVDDEVILKSISISLNTPSVCNRQGWMIHYYNNNSAIRDLLSYQNGNAGFMASINKLLIVTGNTKAFTRYEHNQQFVDGGLLSMNLMYALHSAGLGSCPLNTCMPFNKEEKLKKAAKIPNHEKLIMMIAVGNLKDSFSVARSEKYQLEQVLRMH